MSIVLNPDENVFFPQPYLPGEPAELVITNQRMVRVTEMGMAEFPVKEIDYVGRVSKRPLLAWGIVLLLAGVPLVVVGLYAAIANKGPINALFASREKKEDLPPLPPIPGAPPVPGVAVPGMPGADKKKSDDEEEEDEEDEAIIGQVGGLIMVAGGLVLLVVGYFLTKVQKHTVVARMGPRMTEVMCKDKGEQTMILSTLSSAVSSSKQMAEAQAKAQAAMAQAMAAIPGMTGQPGMPGMAGMPGQPGMAAGMAAAPAAIEVDDHGDPVKALQELKAQKDAGKIDAATFDAKRAVLLGRLRR